MKKIILVLMISIFLITLVNAEQSSLGIIKQNNCIELIQTCSNCTYQNISSVLYPNLTQALGQIAMTKINTKYNYTFCNTSEIGNYIVNGFGDVDGVTTVWAYDFSVTGTGYNSSSQNNAGIYFILVLAVVFFIGFIFVQKDIFKWTFFLMFLFFAMIGVNLISISIYNEIGNTQLGSIFDTLSAASMIFYWFVGGLLITIWVLTALANLADRKTMKQAEQTGALTNFKY